MNKAVSVGIVIDAATGQKKRIINPDFEEEIALHHLDPGERMVTALKADYGIKSISNAMTLEQVYSIMAAKLVR